MSEQAQGELSFRLPIEELLYRQVERRLRQEHRGRHNAVTLDTLAQQHMVNRREMHSVIAELVGRGLPIGSSAGGQNHPPGIYWIVDEEDRRTALGNLLPRALKILKRYHRLSGVSAAEIGGQVTMELER